jgi:indole-3-glycerol phosphate synthase
VSFLKKIFGGSGNASRGGNGAGKAQGEKNILEKIVDETRRRLMVRREEVSLIDLQDMPLYAPPRRDFMAALRAKETATCPAVIAEVKKASPSKGVIRENFNPVAIAQSYAEHGTACISVLTDEPHFQGHLDYLKAIREALPEGPPLLRKDFIIDEYQLQEARAYGADAVLLIASVLDDALLSDLMLAAQELDLQTLVEAYTIEEAERTLKAGAKLMGINNRDLRTFEVDLIQTHRAFEAIQSAGLVDDTLLVSESGLSTSDDLKTVRDSGANVVLIGEHFMREDDPGKALAELIAAVG